MAYILHNVLEGTNFHLPGYFQAADPGVVGAGIFWTDISGGVGNYLIKVRNEANDGWELIAGWSGVSGYSGTSGYSGIATSGYSGDSGYSGGSGYSGVGIPSQTGNSGKSLVTDGTNILWGPPTYGA